MLAITRRPPITKALTSGILAFTIGLTASAAYLSTTIERMPLTFNTEQQTPAILPETGATKTPAAKQEVPSGSSRESALPVSSAQQTPNIAEFTPTPSQVQAPAPAPTQTAPLPVTLPVTQQIYSSPSPTPTPQHNNTKPEPSQEPNLVNSILNIVSDPL